MRTRLGETVDFLSQLMKIVMPTNCKKNENTNSTSPGEEREIFFRHFRMSSFPTDYGIILVFSLFFNFSYFSHFSVISQVLRFATTVVAQYFSSDTHQQQMK